MASEEEKKATLAYEHLEALEDESEDIELELRKFSFSFRTRCEYIFSTTAY